MSNFSLSIRIWFRQNGRKLPWRETNDPYLIWLSEIILQQTRVEQGLPYFERFRKNYPNVHELAQADERAVLNDWQGLGYYSRARNLRTTAAYISRELHGRFPATYQELVKLKGIGAYTAAAISSFAFNERKAVVDGNVYRVLSRAFDLPFDISTSSGKKAFQELADSLICDDEPGLHNQAIMDLGAIVCTPRDPDCGNCPLLNSCGARTNATIQIRPVKSKKQRVKNRYFHYLVYDHEGSTYLEQRTGKDIWEKLYQFPLIETETAEEGRPEDYKHRSKVITHLLSHQRIHAVFYHIDGPPKEVHNSWLRVKKGNIGDYPLPRLIDKYLESLFPEN